MQRRQIAILFSGIFIVLLAYFGYWAFYLLKKQSFSGEVAQIDTLKANRLIDMALQIKGSAPDSASSCYLKAIDLLRPDSLRKPVNHLLGTCYVGLASIHCNNGDYPLSQYYDSLAMVGAKLFDDKDIMAQGLNIKGLLHFNQSEFQPALDYYDRAIRLAREAGNKKVEAKILTNIAIIHYLQGEVDKSIGFFTKTMEVAQSINDDELLSGSYINMGLIASNSGKDELAIENYRKAIEVYQRTDGKDGLILCYQNLGNIWFENGKFTEAIDNFQLSLKLAQEIGDQANIAKGFHNLGEVYAYLGDYETATGNYMKSVDIKEKLNDQIGITFDYNSIGSLNYQMGDYQRALDYYQKSIELSKQLKYPEGIMTSYANLANGYCKLNQFDKGLELAFESLKLHDELKTDNGIDELYSIIGMIYSGKKEYKKAEEFFRKAMETRQKNNDQIGYANSLNEISNLLMTLSREKEYDKNSVLLREIINNAIKARDVARKQKVLPLQNEANLLLKYAYQQLGDFRHALMYADESAQISDSLFNKEKNKALALAEAKWNAQSQQRKIEELEKSQQMQQEIIQRKEAESRLKGIMIYMLLAILVLIILVVVMGILYLRKRKNIQQQRQMANIVNLRMQNARNRMSPHFFFNVLGSLPQLVDQPELLQQRLGNLSLLLRKSLENIENTAISLGEELKVVKAFVELQRERIQAPFEVNLTIDPKVDLQSPVLAMIIQIPVENAIKHGLMPIPGEKLLAVRVEALPEGIGIVVEDNGIGVTASAGRSTGTGTGLKVLLQAITLLNQWNKKKITFSILDKNRTPKNNSCGTVVNIFIPDQFSFNNINYHEPNRSDQNRYY